METSLIDLLGQRVSAPRLTEPAPTKQELEKVFKAALRAPDHMRLRPWRYLVIEGESRQKLSELFLKSCRQLANASNEELEGPQAEKIRNLSFRAPTIVVAIASISEHPNVPEQEQVISCGVGVGYMLLALQSLGYGGVWRTGELARNENVCKGLGLKQNESIVGFLYLGTPVGELKSVPDLSVDDYVDLWQG